MQTSDQTPQADPNAPAPTPTMSDDLVLSQPTRESLGDSKSSLRQLVDAAREAFNGAMRLMRPATTAAAVDQAVATWEAQRQFVTVADRREAREHFGKAAQQAADESMSRAGAALDDALTAIDIAINATEAPPTLWRGLQLEPHKRGPATVAAASAVSQRVEAYLANHGAADVLRWAEGLEQQGEAEALAELERAVNLKFVRAGGNESDVRALLELQAWANSQRQGRIPEAFSNTRSVLLDARDRWGRWQSVRRVARGQA